MNSDVIYVVLGTVAWLQASITFTHVSFIILHIFRKEMVSVILIKWFKKSHRPCPYFNNIYMISAWDRAHVSKPSWFYQHCRVGTTPPPCPTGLVPWLSGSSNLAGANHNYLSPFLLAKFSPKGNMGGQGHAAPSAPTYIKNTHSGSKPTVCPRKDGCPTDSKSTTIWPQLQVTEISLHLVVDTSNS